MRSGVMAQKCGMTRILDNGSLIAVTLLRMDSVVVAHFKKNDKTSMQIGYGDIKEKNVSKPLRGHFSKHNTNPKRYLRESRPLVDESLKDVGFVFEADYFQERQHVDVTGVTIGKGFAGPMKRWNFGGLRATHGVSVSHRSHGSTGQRQDPGKVFKGKKMAGRLGGEQVTVQSLRVIRIDHARRLIFVQGAVPGSRGGFVWVRDAVKKPLPLLQK